MRKSIKGLLVVLSVVLCLGVYGCSSNDNDDYVETEPKTEEVEKEETPEEETTEEEEVEEEEEEKEEPKKEVGVRKDVKEAIDAYEDFYEDYVEFLKKYKKNPSSTKLLKDYAKFMSDLSDYDSKMEALEKDFNEAETAYFLKVNARVLEMLADVQ